MIEFDKTIYNLEDIVSQLSMSADEMSNRIERKRKLEDQLNNKFSNEWKDLVKKSDEYMKQMQEKNRLYYQQQLDKELDDMEKEINSGNTVGAMYHRYAADSYLRLLNLL